MLKIEISCIYAFYFCVNRHKFSLFFLNKKTQFFAAFLFIFFMSHFFLELNVFAFWEIFRVFEFFRNSAKVKIIFQPNMLVTMLYFFIYKKNISLVVKLCSEKENAIHNTDSLFFVLCWAEV